MIAQRTVALGTVALGAAVLALSASISACSESKDLVSPKPPVDQRFARYVSLGNSITAGFQSGGINDSTQGEAYPVLLARQMGTPFTIPALAMPGCPPPIANFLTQARVNTPSPIVQNPPCGLRVDRAGLAAINNVAVPGAFASDPTDLQAAATDNALTTLILGGKTQVRRALDADPTFVSVWIGNDDVLIPSLSGIIVPLANPATGEVISPGVTPQVAFEESYSALLQALGTAPSLEGGVLIGVVNVTNVPIFFPAALMFGATQAQVRGAIDVAANRPVTVDTSCTPTTTSLIDLQLVAAIRAGTAPDTIACHPLAAHANLLGDLYVLDASEIASVSSAVAAYNAYIEAQAKALGWAYVDPNPALAELRATMAIPLFPDLAQPTRPFGDYISLDGIHPAAAAHRLITNIVIDSVNARYGTSIPKLGS